MIYKAYMDMINVTGGIFQVQIIGEYLHHDADPRLVDQGYAIYNKLRLEGYDTPVYVIYFDTDKLSNLKYLVSEYERTERLTESTAYYGIKSFLEYLATERFLEKI